jgi:hypothetical protein
MVNEVSLGGVMRDEQSGFRLRHRSSLQVARLVERITSNFGEKGLAGVEIFDVSKAFDFVLIDGPSTT